MIDLDTLFFTYIEVYAFIIIAVYLIGRIPLIFAKEFTINNSPIQDINNAIIVGSVLIITTYAIVCSKGNSIMWLSVACIIWYIFSREKDDLPNKQSPKKGYSDCISVIIIYLLSYLLFYWLLLYKSYGNLYCDFIYYGNVCHNLNTIHIESSNLLSQVGASPYHWGELWLTAFIAKIFSLKATYCLCLITYPFLLGTLVIATVSVVRSIYPSFGTIPSICAAILLLFFCPILSFAMNWSSPICSHPKLFMPTIFLLWSVIFLIKHQYTLFAASIGLIAPMNSVTAAGSFTFAVVFLLSIIIIKRTKNYKRIVNGIVLLCFITAGYIGFYLLQTKTGASSSLLPLYEGSVLRNIIEFVIKRTARPVVFIFLISTAVFVFCNKIKIQDYIIYCIILLLSCFVSIIFGGILKQYVLDGGQITTMYCEISTSIFILTFGIYTIKTSKSRIVNKYAIYPLCITYLFLAFISFDFEIYNQPKLSPEDIESYKTLKESIDEVEKTKFGYFVDYHSPRYFNTMDTRCSFTSPMNYIANITNTGYYFAHCLSVFDIPDEIEPRFNDVQKSKLFQFSTKYQGDEQTEEIIIDFIHKEGINYIIVTNDSKLPDYLINNAQKIATNSEGIIYSLNI